MAICSSCGDVFDRDKVLCPDCQEIASMRVRYPDPAETPRTDEQVAAEIWRLLFPEAPPDEASPEVLHQLAGQVASVRRALASLNQKTPPETP